MIRYDRKDRVRMETNSRREARRTTQHTAASYRDRYMHPNVSLARLMRLARMVRQERPA